MLKEIDRKRIKEIELYDFLVQTHLADVEIYNAWVRLRCNTSVNIRQGRSYWQDFSAVTDKKYGDAISLLMNFFGYSFKDAAQEVMQYLDGNPIQKKSTCKQQHTETTFRMPKKSKAYPKTVYSYLGKTRHIPYRLIEMLLDGGYVYMTDSKYESKVIHNVVFTTPEHNFYEIRGCSTYGKAFHQSLARTPKDCLIFPGTNRQPKKIYITEAAIDAISLLALHGLSGRIEDAWFVGLGGITKIQPLEYLEKKYPSADIILAVDNDTAGDKLREAYKGTYSCIIPKNKDWNDDLCETYSN